MKCETMGVFIAVSLRHARDCYPNKLREAPTQAQITRVQLVRRYGEHAAQGDGGYVTVGLVATKFLKAGVQWLGVVLV